MSITKTNTSGFQRQVVLARKATPVMALEGAKALARYAGRVMIVASPQDTRRYVSGWIEAVNEAGVGPIPLPPIKESKYAGANRARFEKQLAAAHRRKEKAEKNVKFWEDMIQKRYTDVGRDDKWLRDAQQKLAKQERWLEKAEKVIERAQDELAALTDFSIVIGGRKRKKGVLGLSNLASVHNLAFGGRGSIEVGSDKAVVYLHNLEPHSSIVESRHHVVSRARLAVKSIAGPLVRPKILEALRASGLKR